MNPEHPTIADAVRSLETLAPAAQADPTLPVYHLRPPAGWMGDINAPIFHKGWYHIFYQHGPFAGGGALPEAVYWGHARSRDLVRWEHLPPALCPSHGEGEKHCYSGCAVVNALGTPMIFYTSVGFSRPMEQWAATGDDALIEWTKHPDNPILPESLHTDTVQIKAWRDPFAFELEGRTYLIHGGSDLGPDGEAPRRGMVSLYRAENAELTRWRYVGPLFHHPTSPDNACPNLFRLGDKWVLFMSRHEPHVVNYLVGTLDPETLRFEPESAAPMGYSEDSYATQGLYDARSRLIVWNTMHSYRSYGHIDDWPGCLTLPRVVSLRDDGLVGFEPLPELAALRGRHWAQSDIRLRDSAQVFEGAGGDTLELVVEFEPGDAAAFGIRLRRSDDGARSVEIRYDAEGLEVDGLRGLFNEGDDMGPFRLLDAEPTLSLRIFLDRRVVEAYANGRACFSRLIDAAPDALGVEVFAQGGAATVRTVDVWEMGAAG